MSKRPFLFITTHEDEFHVVGVRAQYIDQAILRLFKIPELAGHHVRNAVAVTDEDLTALRHVVVAQA
jgi:hypothetical protein